MRNRNFHLLWFGQTVSRAGSQITVLALPIAALEYLDASAFEVGVLTAASYLAFLLVGLPAGVFVDRARKKPILITADAARLLVLAAVPVAYAVDSLSMWLLYAVAFLHGLGTVFFDIAYRSFLPALVPRHELVSGNGRLEAASTGAQSAGPFIGGLLISAFSAPLALLCDAFTFALSALCTAAIKVNETRPEAKGKPRLRTEILEGLRLVFGDPTLRAIVLVTGTMNLFLGAFHAVSVPFLIRDLSLRPGSVGLIVTIAGLGGVVGAAIAGRLSRRWSTVQLLRGSATTAAVFLCLAPFATEGVMVALFAVSRFGAMLAFAIYNVTQVSYRQATCPPELLGRMNASLRFVVFGMLPIGSLLGGAVAQWGGNRAALIVVAAGSALGPLWLRTRRLIEDGETGMSDAGQVRRAGQ